MWSTFAVWKEVQKPTALDLCCSGHLLPKAPSSSSVLDLVVATPESIEVLSLGTDLESRSQRFRRRFSLRIFGAPQSIDVIRVPGRTLDSLVLSFEDAKFAVLEYSPLTDDFITTCVLSFEQQNSAENANSKVKLPFAPKIAVENRNRCAVLVVSPSKIAVIPASAMRAAVENHAQIHKSVTGFEEFSMGQSFVMDLAEFDIRSIREVIFLQGYLEPTFAVLHEPIYTWEGRSAIARNSCQIVTFTLDLEKRVCSVLAISEMLPMSTHSMMALPAPLGGLLIFSLNYIIHYGQTIDYVLSLNDFGDRYKDFRVPNVSTGKIVLSLNHTVSTLLSNSEVLISANQGDLYLISITHRRDTILGISLSEVGRSDIASGMCTLSPNYIFIASRIGDSRLVSPFRSRDELFDRPNELAYTEEELAFLKASSTSFQDDFFEGDEEEDLRKEGFLNIHVHLDDTDPALEMELFGKLIGSADPKEEKGTVEMLESDQVDLGFTIVDSFRNVAPMGQFALGTSLYSDFGDLNPNLPVEQRHVDFAFASNFGRNSNISWAYSGVRPYTLSSFDFGKPVRAAWTLRMGDSEFDSFLIMSFDESTEVFSCKADLVPLSSHEFISTATTVVASVVLDGTAIVQISPYSARLLEDKMGVMCRKQDVPLGNEVAGIYVAEAKVMDPLIVLRFCDGSIQMLTARSFDRLLVLSIPELLTPNMHDFPMFQETGKVTAISLYREKNNVDLFSFTAPNDDSTNVVPNASTSSPTSKISSSTEDEDELEKLFFGDRGSTNTQLAESEMPLEPELPLFSNEDDENAEGDNSRSLILCVLTRDDGRLEIYQLPDFKVLFWTSSFPAGFSYYENRLGSRCDFHPNVFRELKVDEILMERIGSFKESLPYITAFLTNGDLIVYRLFECDTNESIPRMRLSKVKHDLILRTPSSTYFSSATTQEKIMKADTVEQSAIAESTDTPILQTSGLQNLSAEPHGVKEEEIALNSNFKISRSRIFGFQNISGLSGIFISGPRPVWIFGDRDHFLPRFQSIRGASYLNPSFCLSFTPFHNEGCNDGFISFTEGFLEVKQLPDPHEVSVDCSLLSRKISLKKTVRQVVYHSESLTYAAAVSYQKPGFSLEDPSPRSLPTYDDVYEVHLIHSGTGLTVDIFKELRDNEFILCMKSLTLHVNTMDRVNKKSEGKSYIVIGTSVIQSEDLQCKGRIILLEIYDSSPSDLTGAGIRFKLVAEEEARIAGVTELCELCGILACAIGPRVTLYKWNGERLKVCAFFDAKTYVSSMVSLKRFLCILDVCLGIFIVYWDAELQSLVFVSKDTNHQEIYGIEFLVNGDDFSIAIAGADGGLRLLGFQPQRPGSQGGRVLLPRADFHVGSHITNFQRIRVRSYDPYAHMRNDYRGPKYMLLGGSDAGSLSILANIEEMVYRRLYSLHTQLTFKIHHYGGLNPRLYRTVDSSHMFGYTTQRNVIDATLIWQYPQLDYYQQRKLARNIGTTPDNIIANLLDIDLETVVF